MSEHLLFLNIINVKERCHIREILSNYQLPFCASNNSCLLLLQGRHWFSKPNSQHLCQSTKAAIRMADLHRISATYEYLFQRYCDPSYNGYQNQDLFQDSPQIFNSSTKSSEIGHSRSPEIDTHYPVTVMESPVSRMGFPVSIGISGFSKICPSVWILVLKTFLWISGHFQVEIFLKTWCVSE